MLTTMYIRLHNETPLIAAGASHFFVLIQKSNQKKSSPQKCFFALQAFAHKTGENLGLQLLSPA